MTPTLVVTPSATPARGGAQVVRTHPRGRGQLSEGQAHCYAFLARPEVEASDTIIQLLFQPITKMHQFYLILVLHVPICHRTLHRIWIFPVVLLTSMFMYLHMLVSLL